MDPDGDNFAMRYGSAFLKGFVLQSGHGRQVRHFHITARSSRYRRRGLSRTDTRAYTTMLDIDLERRNKKNYEGVKCLETEHVSLS